VYSAANSLVPAAWLMWLAAVGALSACTESHGGHGLPDAASADASADAGAISAEAFVAGRTQLQCETALRCEARDHYDTFFERACHPSAVGSRRFGEIDAVARRRAEFDPSAAQACLDRLAGVTCFRGRSPELPECARVFRGLVPPGGACSTPTLFSAGMLECVDGAECSVGDSCPGECVASPIYGAEGAPCDPLTWCDSEHFCRDGACAAFLGAGEPCTSFDECRVGLICGPEAAATTVCLDPYAVTSPGGPCVFGPGVDTCPVDLVCVCDGCVLTGVCVTPAPLGAPCDPSTPCGLSARCVERACRAIALPLGDCSGGAVCPGTHACDGVICRPLPTYGEACTEECFNAVCLVEGNVCGFVGGLKREGVLCDRAQDDCDDGLECRAGDDAMYRCFPEC